MITPDRAKELLGKYLPPRFKLCDCLGEAQGKYIFPTVRYDGIGIPGGMHWTVDKETGECKCEYLEREFLAPYAPIRGFKKLDFPE